MNTLAEDLGISRQKLIRMFSNLEKDGVVKVENADNRFSIITILNFKDYQESFPEVRTTVDTTVDTTAGQLPDTFLEFKNKNINTDSLRESCRPLARADEEHHRGRNLFLWLGEYKFPAGPLKELPPNCDYQALMNLYHETLPELPKIRSITGGRRTHTQTRWVETWQRLKAQNKPRGKNDLLNWFKRFFLEARKSDWLMGRVTGRNGTAWKAHFDFLVSPKGYTRLWEGFYTNRRPNP
jgi:hypothetical protein